MIRIVKKVYNQFLRTPCPEERYKTLSCDKPEKIKLVHFTRVFHNGKGISFENGSSLSAKSWLCANLDLKDAYLSVPLHKNSQLFLRCKWKEKI